MTFNDDYQAERKFDDGEEWIIVEPDRAVLKRRRTQLGLTQQEVADAAHIQLRQYQCLESGKRTVASTSMRIGFSVCTALKLDPRRFVHGVCWDES